MHYVTLTVENKTQYRTLSDVLDEINEDCPYDFYDHWTVPRDENEIHRITLKFHLQGHINHLTKLLADAEMNGDLTFPFQVQTFQSFDEMVNDKYFS